jgi:predicted MFS family arabinose efflux permease
VKESFLNPAEPGPEPACPGQSGKLGASADSTAGLALLFGAMYFVQGIAEPTEGLIAQPVRSLLRSWNYSAAQIGGFMFLLSIPWVIKPLYGLLTDFVPLAGTRRRSYLILTSGATALALAGLYLFPPERGQYLLFLFLLLTPTVGVAFSDVVVDALMVEKGQPLGLTGRLQSVQWTTLSIATLAAAEIGGYLSEHRRQTDAFLICAAVTMITFVLAWAFVREERRPRHKKADEVRSAAVQLGKAARTPAVLAAAAFLFLWSFNPFSSSSVLYTHMRDELNLGERFYSRTVQAVALGGIAASLAYGIYCRRVPMRWLIHGAILAGIAGSLLYWGLSGPKSALAISFLVGFTYMTGTLVQLDVTARACPVAAAGSVFALLMSLSNLAMSSAEYVGGSLYVALGKAWGNDTAFNALVAIGALTTCGCWLVAPLLSREMED